MDAVVSTIVFPLVGGPAGSMAGGRNANVGEVILQQLNVLYIVAAPFLVQDIDSWKRNGVAGLQSVVLYSLTELDGAIDTVCIGGLVGEEIYLLKDRLERLTGLLKNWITLRRKRNVEKKVAIIIYGVPPSTRATGTAALLNVPQSLSKILKRLENEGYDVGNGASLTSDQILTMVKEADEVLQRGRLGAASAAEALRSTKSVKSNELREWLGPIKTKGIELSWNSDVGSSNPIKTVNKMHLLGGVEFGNVWIRVQPPLGIIGDPIRLMFERHVTPHPQYAAFYRWLEKGLGADATIHVRTHGTYEWLPGNPRGNTKDNWSDIFMENLPNLYVYAANNPSEGSLAKRCGYATIISHNVPPYGRAALYGQLDQMKSLVWEFNAMQAGGQRERLEEITNTIEDKLVTSRLNNDLWIEASELEASEYVAEVSNYLKTLKSRLFSSGLHILGKAATPEEAVRFVEAILGDNPDTVLEEDRLPLCASDYSIRHGRFKLRRRKDWTNFSLSTYREVEELQKATENLRKLLDTRNELDNVVRGLNGEFIEALPGGDVLRDGISVLPTGSNIHALDRHRLPSPSACLTRRAIAERVMIEVHRNANDGNNPETVAVPLRGLDNIKTKGESVGIALGMIGAEPVLDGTGRVLRFELVDSEKLGRPRVAQPQWNFQGLI